ncbi:MAG TPA: hypothetical protein VMT80_01925 [Candidatus Paceibacterota bacterium]|nr:hypothetical protein [Candidatus Paceibacterota bacterium]
MDEILIEEKRYVSSKRAAQITGYAKDYVGQLCREGRVPARLVGRSWYVLESAIQDHRFGKPDEENTAVSIDTSGSVKEEFPRYEAVEAQILPSINRLEDSAPIDEPRSFVAPAAEQGQETTDAWKNWFDASVLEPIRRGESKESPVLTPEEEILEEKEVEIPIRAIHHPELRTVREEMGEPIRTQTQAYSAPESEDIDERVSKDQTRYPIGYRRAIQATGVVFAVLAVAMAVLGSGYIDSYAGSLGPASVLAGITQIKR